MSRQLERLLRVGADWSLAVLESLDIAPGRLQSQPVEVVLKLAVHHCNINTADQFSTEGSMYFRRQQES